MCGMIWTHCDIDYSYLGSFYYTHMQLMLCFVSSAFFIDFFSEGEFGSILLYDVTRKYLTTELFAEYVVVINIFLNIATRRINKYLSNK